MTQFVEQLRNQAKWYAQPGHNARDLMDSRLLEKAADEIERLRAKIEAMERQAPVAWTTKLALEHRESTLGFRVSSVNIWGEKGVPLYALPGAHPKPDCGEAGHDEGRCGNKQCLSGAQTQGEEK